jgi:raffinose/stachyose/melibiose transport system substrate-binding protein
MVGAQTIEYYSLWNLGEDHQAVMEHVIKDFEAENPGVSVRVTWAGRDVITMARSRLLMGNPPDLIDQSFMELWGSLLANGEMALPMNDFLETEGPEGQERMADVFMPNVLELYETDGNIYFIPYEFITSGFFYDKNVFEEYGLEAPKTWDDLLHICEVLQANGIVPFAQDNTSNYTAYWYYWMINRLMGPGALLQASLDPTGEAWDDPLFLQAAEMLYEISRAGKNYFLPGYEGSVWPSGQISWANGEAAMLICGNWIPNETADARYESYDVGYFPFPQITGGDDTNSMEGYLIGFAIPHQAKNPELAKEFIRFTLREEYQDMVAKQAENIAARPDVAYPEVLVDVKPYVDAAPQFHVEYDGTQGRLPEWYNNIFVGLAAELINGSITPERFIQTLKDDSISLHARAR